MKKNLSKKGLAVFLMATTLVTGGVVVQAPFLNSSVYAKETAKELSPEKQLYRFLFENNIEDNSEAHHPVQVSGKPAFVQGRAGLGKSIHFQSTSKENASWIDLGENDEMKFGETQDFTISFWVKSPGVDADPGIISNKDWSSGTYQNEFLYKRVVVIGIDGAGNAVKDPEAKADAKAMIPTISAQNWGAILHGVTSDKHQLTNDIVAATPYPEKSAYPSYMKLLKQERPKLAQASFATWGSINIGIIEDSADSYKQNSGSDEETAKKVVDYIKKEGKNTRNIFVHFDEVDGAGHDQGYFTPKFYKQLQKEDEYVGNIIKAFEDEGLMEDTLIILTADHGGKGTGHGGSSLEEQTIFWAAKGALIAPGTELSEVKNMDTAAVVARALRLDIPKNWDAKIPEGLFQDKE